MKRTNCIVCLAFLCVVGMSAQIIHVPDSIPSIQGGIEAAGEGDTVLVANGTYVENINFLGKAITVASEFLLDGDTSHISKTIIDGSQPVHPDTGSVVLMISGEDTTSVLCGFTITGGLGTYFTYMPYNFQYLVGGGLLMAWSGGKIEYNIFEENHLTEPKSEMAVLGFGIGAFVRDNHTAIFRNNTVRNNSFTGTTAANGAGMGLGGGKMIVEDNFIYRNTSHSNHEALGGGIAYWRLAEDIIPELIIRNNQIYENELSVAGDTPSGGGIYLSGDDLPLDILICNNLIHDNKATAGAGGGLTMLKSNPLVCNNTIVNNEAESGKQLYLTDGAELTLFNNIIWSEMDDGNPEIQIQQNDNVKLNALYNDIRGGWQGPGNIEVDPLFKVDSFMLAAESKCIGRGTDSIRVDNSWVYAPILDIYGMERPRASTDRRIDLGAVESPYDYPLQYQSESMINVPGEKPTIQSGIDAASEGDTVLVANGIYYENIDFKGKAITVASEFLLDGDPSHISRTMIDGSQFTDPLKASTVTILDVLDNEFLLAGFTIMGGEGSAFMLEDGIGSFGGGGILMISSSGTIRNNIIEKNIIESAEGRGFSAVAIGPGNSDTVYVYDNVIRENELHTESIGIGTVGLGAGGKKVTIHFHNNIVTRNIITTTAPYNIHGAGLLIQTEYSYGADIRVYNNRIDHNELHCQSSVGSGI